MEYLAFERVHETGVVARVYRDDEGAGYRAGTLPPRDETPESEWPYLDTIEEAQTRADALAHPDCQGIGCGRWTAAPPLPHRP